MRAGLGFAMALATGCSLVLDGQRHRGGEGGTDAGPGPGVDAGRGPDAGAPGPVPPEDFCEELANVACYAEEHCCPTPRSASKCRVDIEGRCSREFAAAATDPRARYSPSIAREVLEEGRGHAMSCDEASALRWLTYRVIEVFEGTVPMGAECETAAFPDPVKLVSCVDDNVCRLIGSFWVRQCLPRVMPSARCYESYDCVPGHRCAGEPATCVPALSDGAACTSALDCQSLLCAGAAGMMICQAQSDSAFCSMGAMMAGDV